MLSSTEQSQCTNGSSDKIPPEFICCLTLDILSDPVTTPRGFTFERKAITKWLMGCDRTCPLSREPLEEWELVNNNDLREEISKWKKDRGIGEDAGSFRADQYDSSLSRKVLDNNPHLINVRERILRRREDSPLSRKVLDINPHLIDVRERILQRREQQFRTILSCASC